MDDLTDVGENRPSGATAGGREWLPGRELRVRQARADDVDAMARVQAAAWREGFAGLVAAELTPSTDRLAERLGERLRDPSCLLEVATVDGAVRGFCASGPNRDAGAAVGCGEVHALFVDPCAWRLGLGRALAERALADLAGRGFGEVTVWSFAENARANAFYAGQGFARDGAEQRRPELGRSLIVRYRRRLPRTRTPPVRRTRGPGHSS